MTKLVRDKIPSLMQDQGLDPKTYIASDEEYRVRLKEKLQEEVAEFLQDENEEEIADIFEVLDALIALKGFSKESIDEKKRAKAHERGGFSEKIILED